MRSSALIDKWSLVPILAFFYVAIALPLITFFTTDVQIHSTGGDNSNLLNQIAWPVMTAIAFGIAAQNRVGRLTWPPNILWLFACLALAVASTLWAYKPATTFVRSTQQVMLILSIVLTPIMMVRGADTMRALFWCFAIGVVLNWSFGARTYADDEDIGYGGFVSGKNNLGQFAAMAFLVAVYEMYNRGTRRLLGIILAFLAAGLVIYTQSKTSTALAFVSPLLAIFMLILHKTVRISGLVVLSVLTAFCIVFRDGLAWYVFHDVTLTGRTFIWDFVNSEISRRPILGWGYLSFWLVGPDGPSIMDNGTWVAGMPHAHNGYLDMRLQLGLIGFVCLLMFIATTILAIERIAKQDLRRAWLLLSLVVFVIFNNFLESSWMHSADMVWVAFLIVATEAGRGWLLYQSGWPASVSKNTTRLRPGRSRFPHSRIPRRSAPPKEPVVVQQQ